MTPILSLVVYMTLLTFVAILLGAFLRHQEWTGEGLQAGLSNRDHLPEPTPLGGRAERAAANTIEALLMFVPLALVAHLAGQGDEVLLGAHVFLVARLIYLPVYLMGIIYVRSLIWGVGIVGLAMMVVKLF